MNPVAPASASTMPARPGTAALGPARFEIHRGLAGLEQLCGHWEALAAGLPSGARFFHWPHWYRAFLVAHPDADPDTFFVAAWREGGLVAVFPLQFQRYEVLGLRPRLLGTIDDDQLQLSDFVFDPQSGADADFLAQLVQWLRSSRELRWDVLRLRKVPDDAHIARSARVRLPGASLVAVHDGSCWIDAAHGYDAATKPISKTFKQDFRRLTRRAEKTHPLRLEIATRPEELGPAFDHFLEIEGSGWKGAAGISGAILCQPALLRFYRELVHEFGARGQCVVNLLWHGERPVAGHLCVRDGRVLNILKVGFREDCEDFAPGILLLDRVIRNACEDPATDTLHLVNEPPWSRKFRPQRMDVWSYVIANRSLSGLAVLVALWIKRASDRIRGSAAAGPTTRPRPAGED